MPKKYKKKPVVIEAIRWYGFNEAEIDAFCPARVYTLDGLSIQTLEGLMKADIGDYIIKGIKGEFYPCKEDIFNLTYDLADSEPKSCEDVLDGIVRNTPSYISVEYKEGFRDGWDAAKANL